MKTLHIGDRYFDPFEIDHLELIGTILHVYYRNSDFVSKIKFDTYEEAALEYYYLPDYLRKSARRR
ncbi:MAG: hypothetical protein EHM58_03260 [Ignavibacteriae bacterium]|nr:MAG: hypothetical protein EHM58_03260 [Ignavibacteriota bacterium]